jgi:hypothetical protein
MQVLNAPVDLLVTAYLETAGLAVPSLKIDKIALEGDAASAAGRPLQIPPKGISVIGHVERSGDQVVAEGQRLGDPQSNLRLEGFQVMWPDKPDSIDLSYSALVEGAGETPTVSTGKFCGTRNAAKRIVGVAFSLTGPQASNYKLTGEAFFSGGFTRAIDPGVQLAGPTGLEHLSALQLSVEKANVTKARQGAWAASPKTQIFKRSSKKA